MHPSTKNAWNFRLPCHLCALCTVHRHGNNFMWTFLLLLTTNYIKEAWHKLWVIYFIWIDVYHCHIEVFMLYRISKSEQKKYLVYLKYCSSTYVIITAGITVAKVDYFMRKTGLWCYYVCVSICSICFWTIF